MRPRNLEARLDELVSAHQMLGFRIDELGRAEPDELRRDGQEAYNIRKALQRTRLAFDELVAALIEDRKRGAA